MLNNARHLLNNEYQKCLDVVKDSAYFTSFAEEKLHHSLQVLGAGNYIVKHEERFKKRDAAFIETAKTAVLLHDISRFDEIKDLYRQGQAKDHGIAGYEKLASMPEYNHDLIALPIKHHGHLNEDFWNDTTFQNITNADIAADCESIFYLIRDADKIANFNIVCYETEKYLPLFIPEPTEVELKENRLTDEVVDDFLRLKTIDYPLRRSRADYWLTFISWFFDLNYRSSVVFCRRLNLLPAMFKLLRRYHDNEALNIKLETTLDKYLTKKFG